MASDIQLIGMDMMAISYMLNQITYEEYRELLELEEVS